MRHVRSVVIRDEYYEWLVSWVNIRNKASRYNLLLKTLHQKKFEWFVPNDDNRAFDGKELRVRFCDEEGLVWIDWRTYEPSMFEVILALAFRCDSIMADSIDNVSVSEWFWRLLNNAGLDIFDDDHIGHLCDATYEINQILDKINNRTYKRNGDGGLFPLRKPKKDQRKTELWYQMCLFLVENFYCEDVVL